MNVLEQLKEDAMRAAGDPADDNEKASENVGAVLDEFIAGHEVVEVYENAPLVCEPLKGGVFRQWHNDMRQHLSTARRLTIIVPRAEPPSLLAAAEAVWERITLTERHRSVGATVCSDMGGALDALAQAIKRAREGNE
jgi:hypothetical protein